MWAAVCRVLINEIITLRSLYADPSVPALPGREEELILALDQLQASMAALAPTSALMSKHYPRAGLVHVADTARVLTDYQLGRIQQERISV
jgi:hypothetical protein